MTLLVKCKKIIFYHDVIIVFLKSCFLFSNFILSIFFFRNIMHQHSLCALEELFHYLIIMLSGVCIMFMPIAWTSERHMSCSRSTCGVWQSWDVNSGRPALELRVFTAEPHSPNFLRNWEILCEAHRRKISHIYMRCAKSLQFCQIGHHYLNLAKRSIYSNGRLFSSIFLCILISTF